MIVHTVSELPVVVEDKPSSLPSLSSVDRVAEIPVWGHKEIATLRDFTTSLENFTFKKMNFNKDFGF